MSVFGESNPYALFDFVADRLDDAGVVALAEFFGSPQIVACHLHFLLLECHHGVLGANKHLLMILYNAIGV